MKQKKSVNILRGTFAVALAVVVAMSFPVRDLAAENNQEAKASQGRSVLTVAAVMPERQDWPVAFNVSGSLAAWQQASISSEIGGLRVVQVLADVGDVVKRGQPLVLLSTETVLADVRRQEAAVAQAKASMDEAKVNAERARSIRNSGAMSAQQINQYLVAEETAKAALAVASAQLDSERLRLTQTRIVAPDDGVVFSRHAELGAVVAPGAELFRMVRQGRIEWQAEVSSQQLPQVSVGQKARLTLPGGKTVEGTVRMIAPTLETTTRNAQVYVALPKSAAEAGARIGMYVSGQLLGGNSPALSVPQSAVVLRDGNSYIYEIDADDRVRQHLVVTGRYHEGRVEIVRGLRLEARVVQTGGAFLSDGDKVSVTTAGAAGATGTTEAGSKATGGQTKGTR